jgi:transposase
VARINAGGIEALCHQPGSGAPQKLPADQEELFLARIDAGPRYITARPKHPHRATDEEQQKFTDHHTPFFQKVARTHSEKEIRIAFEDESHFGQHGMLSRLWAPRGTRPRIPRQTEYEVCYLFGAFFPDRGDHIGPLLPRCNTAAMALLLEEISKGLAPDEHCVLILDNAGWHRARALQWPPNITPHHLPPYTPELNPAETIWAWIKSHHLSNQIFQDYDALLEAGQRAWRSLTASIVKSITQRQWVTFALTGLCQK